MTISRKIANREIYGALNNRELDNYFNISFRWTTKKTPQLHIQPLWGESTDDQMIPLTKGH